MFSSSGDVRPTTAFKPGPLLKEITVFPESSAVSKDFGPKSLKGKQIWYISAPAEVPLEDLENISLENANRGKSVMTHNSSEYGFIADNENSKKNLYVSVPAHDGYTFSKNSRSSLERSSNHDQFQQKYRKFTTCNKSRIKTERSRPLARKGRNGNESNRKVCAYGTN